MTVDPWLIALIVIFGVLMLYLGLSIILYRKIFLRAGYQRDAFIDQDDPFFKPSFQWYERSPKETVKIKAYDNTPLSGVFLPSFDDKSTQTAIVLHGYQSRHEDLIAIAKMYSDMGFKILLVDQRGHGDSGGQFTSFGHFEKMDLKKWILYVVKTYGANEKILLHGVSLGASTVMLASELALPDQVRLVVADSGFTSLPKLFFNNMKIKLGVLFFPGIDCVLYFMHRYLLCQVSPIHAVKKSHIPIVFLHGEADREVPVSMANSLHEASGASFKELYLVPDAPHGKAYVFDKQGVEQHLFAIIRAKFEIKKSIAKQMK